MIVGYMYLLGAVLTGAAKGYAGKICSRHVKGLRGAVMMNIVRVALCFAIGTVILLVQGGTLTLDRPTILTALFSGFSMSIFLLAWILAIQNGVYVMLEICSSAGLIIPCVLGQFLFGETVSAVQYVGIALLMVAIVILNGYNSAVKGRATAGQIGLMVMVCLGSGCLSLTAKMYNAYAPQPDAMLFNTLTFLVSALLLGVAAYFLMRGFAPKELLPLRRVSLPLGVMAVMLFVNNVFKTRAAGLLPSVLLFPLMNGLAVIVASLMAMLFFHEKVTRRSALGLALAVLSLVVINGL